MGIIEIATPFLSSPKPLHATFLMSAPPKASERSLISKCWSVIEIVMGFSLLMSVIESLMALSFLIGIIDILIIFKFAINTVWY